MATDPSPLEELKDLLAKTAPAAKAWRDALPILRAQSSATSVVLQELARTPISAVRRPRTAGVDVVLAAPSREWAEDLVSRLEDALPQARLRFGQPGERLPDASPPECILRCEVLLPKVLHTEARDVVLRAFRSMDGLKVDYSEPIDLIVVAPALAAY
jgi:hypothetical protein